MKVLAGVLVVAAIIAAALPIDDRRDSSARPRPAATPTPTPTATPAPQPRDVRRAHCSAGVPGCRAVRGTVLYVEHVDPDGDGDLHVVVNAGSITLPGLTSIDVAAHLRPRRDPGIGDRVSAAGPVQTGSFGQSQIHALEFHAQR